MGDFDQQIEAYAEQLERQAERDAARAERKGRETEPHLSAEERARQLVLAERRKSIELARSRVQENLARVGPGRYRDQLEQSLASLDQELAGLEA
jgi:hypothetical protein